MERGGRRDGRRGNLNNVMTDHDLKIDKLSANKIVDTVRLHGGVQQMIRNKAITVRTFE